MNAVKDTAERLTGLEERLACIEQQNERLALMLEVMLTKAQRERLGERLAESETNAEPEDA